MTTALHRRLLLEPPWSPKRIQGLVAWFDASTITGLADAAAVSQWNDLSGNANHLTQSTGPNQPPFKLNRIGGLPSLDGDGANFRMATADLATLNFTAFSAFFVVVVPGGFTASFRGISGKYETGQTKGYNIGLVSGLLRANVAGASSIDTGAVGPDLRDGVQRVVSWTADATTNKTWVNGVAAGNASGTWTPTNAATGLAVFTRGNEASSTADIELGEVLYVNRVVSFTERTQIERYLGRKWRAAM